MRNNVCVYQCALALFSAIVISPLNATEIDPRLKTPEEQSRQIQLDTQQQQRKLETQKILKQQHEPQPNIRDADLKFDIENGKNSTLIPDSESPCFVINSIELVGDDAAMFKFALDEVLSQSLNIEGQTAKSILGHCFGVLGINAVLSRVQNAILTKGYITTRVLVAPQDLKTGVLQFTVVAGRIGAIRLTPDSSRYISPWLALQITIDYGYSKC